MQGINIDILNPKTNYWIGGGMDFFQRRTTLTISSGQAGYVADRSYATLSGATSKSITQAQGTTLPSGLIVPAKYGLTTTNNTAVASLAAGDIFAPYTQRIEGQIISHLNAGHITIGFWLYSSAAISLPVSVRNAAGTLSYVQMVSIASGFEYYTVYVPLSGIIIASDNTAQLYIDIGSIAGTTYQSPTLNSWVAGNYLTHSSQSNWAASTGVKFHLVQAQIRAGIVPLNEMKNTFVRSGGTIPGELRNCRRYYEKGIDPDVLPGTGNQPPSVGFASANQNPGGTRMSFGFIEPKRAIPIVRIFSNQTGAVNQIYNASGASDLAASSSSIGLYGASGSNTATGIAGNIYTFYYDADADY